MSHLSSAKNVQSVEANQNHFHVAIVKETRHPDQREDLRESSLRDRYTRHEVAARTGVPTNRSSFVGWPSAVGPSGRTVLSTQKFRPRSRQRTYKFPEQSIGPCKPGPSKLLGVVLVVALVHKAKSLRRALQHRERPTNLARIAARNRIDYLRHRPDHPRAFMRPANPFSRRPAKEPGIALTPAKRPSPRIKRRIERTLQIRQSK